MNSPIPMIAPYRAVLDNHTADLLRLKLAQRDTLPRAANGRSMAPSDEYVVSVLKDMQQGKSREIYRLLATDLCALRDGVKRPIVKQWLRRYEAILDFHSGHSRERSLIALSRAETREECEVNLAQLRISASTETDRDALENLSRKLSDYQGVFMELHEQVHHHIARIDGATIERASLPGLITRLK